MSKERGRQVVARYPTANGGSQTLMARPTQKETQTGAMAMDTTSARLQHIEDILEIQELTARYNHTFDAGDAEGYADCWTDDGTMTHDVRPGHSGRDAFLDTVRRYDSQVIHMTTDHVVEVEGDTATQDCSFVLFTRAKDRSTNNFFMTGRYHDELVRTSAGWKFQRRTTQRDVVSRSLVETLGLPPDH